MRSISFIVALLFAFVATTYAWPEFHQLEARKGNKNGTTDGHTSKKSNGTTHAKNTVNKQCAKIAKLTKLTELAGNQTKLDAQLAKGKLNQTEIDDLKAKAANATTTLQTLTSNTTLVSECEVVAAHEKVQSQCKQIKSLQKLADLANNQTAIDALKSKKNLNDTQITKLEDRIANATSKLKDLQSNTTLTSLCTSEEQNKGKNSSGSASSTGSATPAKATGAASSLRGLATGPVPIVVAVATVFALFM